MRALLIKAPGKPVREGHAVHAGRLFVPSEHRGKGLSTGITRDFRALLQSRALAPPLDAVSLICGQAEPSLSGVCASTCPALLIVADGRASWHAFSIYGWDLHEPLVDSVPPSGLVAEPLRLADLAEYGSVLGARLRARLEAVRSDKTCCVAVPTADTIKHRCLGHLLSLNQLRGEREPIDVIGARIGTASADVALIIWLPKIGDSCAAPSSHIC